MGQKGGIREEKPGGARSAGHNKIKVIKSPESKMSKDDKNENEEEKGERHKWYGYGKIVPVPNIDDYSDFNLWTKCVTAWSMTTNIPKCEQGYILCQEIPINSKNYGNGLREDIYKHCPPDKLINDVEGVTKVIDFLKTRFYVDVEKDVYDTHAKIKYIQRKKGQSLNDYILEHDKLYTKGKQLKIVPEGEVYDMCMALDLMVTADLTSYEFMLIRSVADVMKGDGKRYETVKQKMRDILGKNDAAANIPKEEVFLTQKETANVEDDIQKSDEIYLNKGWKPPPNYNPRYQNNRNRYQNRNNGFKSNNGTNYNKDKHFIKLKPRNPLGADGKPMKCLSCKAETHLIRECPDTIENIRKKNNKKLQTALLVDKETLEEQEVLIELSDSDQEQGKESSVYCSIYCAEKQEDLSAFTIEALNKAALDTCATASIAGEKWLQIYLGALTNEQRQKVKGPLKSNRHFMFGNQGKLKSKGKYVIPTKIGGEEKSIEMDVISSDIPLLLSKSEMKKLGIVLDMKNDKASMNGKPLILTTTSAGHYVIDLLDNKEELEEVCIAELEESNDTIQMKALSKIHRQFGHRSKHQFVTILKEAGKWQEKFSKMIDKIMEGCEACILRRKTPDRPAVAPPLASDFGEVVGLDLKVWDKNKNIYILYMIDLFTRYQVATVIRSKEPEEIVKAVTTKWLPVFGRMQKIITDNGTEFQNEQMREVASQLNVELLSTGANAPWMNGLVERNHYTTDTIVKAVKRDYPNMSLDVALAWAVTAVNSMSSVRGFSPYQLVFGRSIKLPNILEDPPPTWEEPKKSKTLIDTLNAIHTARVEYTKAERCERIKRALKAKIRVADTIYERGDIVYFKKEGEDTWRGPAKVVFQDSKVIFLRIGSIYYRVSANRVIKAGESLANDIKAKEASEEDNTSEQRVHNNTEDATTGVTTRSKTQAVEEPDWYRLRMEDTSPENTGNLETPTEQNGDILVPIPYQTESIDREPDVVPDQVESESEESDNINQGPEEANEQREDEQETTAEKERKGRKRKKLHQKPIPELNEDGTIKNAADILKRYDRIEIMENGKWEKGTVLGHGGKVGGKHSGWYNIQLDNGNVFHDEMSRREVRYETDDTDQREEDEDEILLVVKLDTGKIIGVKKDDPRKVWFEREEDQIAKLVTEEILAVLVPRDQTNTPECLAAKHEELNKLIAFDTYTVVKDEGQDRITTTWVLTDKGTEKRARLTARGFQEDATFPTDSPTVQKHSMRLLLAIAATEGWDICTTDISSAFLQGSEMDRKVYVKPPREANQAGWLWLLNKCLYGLKDASRKWYLRVLGKLKELGFQVSKYDAGLFYLIKDGILIGIVALHVDDFLHAGNKHFNETVLPQLLGCFKVGKSENKEFMYTGFYLKQDQQGIRLDQNKYVRNVVIPPVDVKQMKDREKDMDQEQLTLLRQITGIVNWTTRSTRPDLCFEMIDLSTKFKGGKVEDLIKAKNVAARLKREEVSVMISNLGDLNKCEIIVYTDAAFRNLNNNTDSCGGYIVFIVNMNSGKVAPLEWRSNKLKRRVHSTLGAETQALYNGLDAAVGLKLLLKELYNGKVDLKVKAITDNYSAKVSVYSESEVGERILRGDIAVIKQMIQNETVAEIRWVTGDNMLADILTKRGVNKQPLLEVLEYGQMKMETLDLVR